MPSDGNGLSVLSRWCFESKVDEWDVCSFFLYCSGKLLLNPKSQILTWHSLSIRMLPGLISLCMTFAECKKLMAQSMLYKMVVTCCSLKSILTELFRTFLRSDSMYSRTMNIKSCSTEYTTSLSPDVKQFWGIRLSTLKICISLSNFLVWYSFSNRFCTSFIATISYVLLFFALTTYP